MPLLLLILLFLIIGFFAFLLKLTLLAGIITLTFFIVRWILSKDQIISYKNGRQIGIRHRIKQTIIQKSDMESNRTTTEQKQNQYKQSEYLE